MGSPGWRSGSVSKVGMGAGRAWGFGGSFLTCDSRYLKFLVFLHDLSWGCPLDPSHQRQGPQVTIPCTSGAKALSYMGGGSINDLESTRDVWGACDSHPLKRVTLPQRVP